MQTKFETTDFEKVKAAIFILAQAIENGRIQGVCHDVTEALYPDSEVVDHSELDQAHKAEVEEAFNRGRGEGLLDGVARDIQSTDPVYKNSTYYGTVVSGAK